MGRVSGQRGDRNGGRRPAGGGIGVVVVEDHPLYRTALVAALSGAADVTVRAQYGDLAEFQAAPGPAPDVVVLDLRLPGVRGVEGVRACAEAGLRVLVLSAAAGREDVVEAFAAGARGYVTKAADAHEILAAVRSLARGETYVAPSAAVHLVSALRTPAAEPAASPLSPREKDVLALVAAGHTDQDVAHRLFIGLTTVRSHLESIRTKTGQRRRAELVLLAIEHGLVEPRSRSS